MKVLYDNLNIEFSIENIQFSTLNIAKECFTASVPKHSHGNNCYELHYVARGYGFASIGPKSYKLSPHTLYITGPHIEHEQIPFRSDPMMEYSVFLTVRKKKTKSDLFSCDPLLSDSFWMTQSASGLLPVFEEIFMEFKGRDTGYLFQVKALLEQCIIMVLRMLSQETCSSKSTIKPAHLSDSRAFIADKAFLYEYGDLTLEKLADYLGLSPRQTERFLKEYYKKGFAQKLKDARMSAASVLMNDPSLTILEVAERIGYSSVEHFSALFKKYYCTTPRKYRKVNQNPAVPVLISSER